MIEVDGLTKNYGSLTAIQGLQFKVAPGEVVGLLGPNGAGKTTTMRILSGYFPPSSGTVRIGGINIQKSPREAKRKIGYLPEIPPLYPDLTVEESLQFVAGLFGIPSQSREIEEVLKKTGIENVRKRLVGNISKGYRQRLGIAQALIHRPDLLILDEPTIGLDPKQILEIRNLIRGLRGLQTVILSSHRLQEVSAVCDRVIIIHHGRIVADGKMEELAQKSRKQHYLVTAEAGDGALREKLERLDGVEEVKVQPTDLEQLFLELTEDKSAS